MTLAKMKDTLKMNLQEFRGKYKSENSPVSEAE